MASPSAGAASPSGRPPVLHPACVGELELMLQRGVKGFRRRRGTVAAASWVGYVVGIDHILRALGYMVEMVDGEPTGRILRRS